MFLNLRADAVRSNVEKYERQLDKAELKYILQIIKIASRQGYTKLEWHTNISETNICMLIKYGYNIIVRVPNRFYEIHW
jgi:hypothetical protein